MQVDFNPEFEEERIEELRKSLGFAEDPVPFDAEKAEKALERPEVKQVRVFQLEAGMRVNIRGTVFKVIRVRDDGKIVLKPAKNV